MTKNQFLKLLRTNVKARLNLTSQHVTEGTIRLFEKDVLYLPIIKLPNGQPCSNLTIEYIEKERHFKCKVFKCLKTFKVANMKPDDYTLYLKHNKEDIEIINIYGNYSLMHGHFNKYSFIISEDTIMEYGIYSLYQRAYFGDIIPYLNNFNIPLNNESIEAYNKAFSFNQLDYLDMFYQEELKKIKDKC